MNDLPLQLKIQESTAYLKQYITNKPSVAIVLGTGLDGITDSLVNKVAIAYRDIPHFPTSSVASHQGQLLLGSIAGRDVLIVSGRVHYYEGYDMKEVTYYMYLLHALDIKSIILSSASGGVNPHYEEGDLVMITDHINLFPDHPLRGINDEKLGPRFPDMMNAYDPKLRKLAKGKAKEINISLKTGVYLGLSGPSLETPAEYRMARILGADLVGMSTVPEVIVANYLSMNVMALTIVSNVCFPSNRLTPTTIQEVIDNVRSNSTKLTMLVRALLQEELL